MDAEKYAPLPRICEFMLLPGKGSTNPVPAEKHPKAVFLLGNGYVTSIEYRAVIG